MNQELQQTKYCPNHGKILPCSVCVGVQQATSNTQKGCCEKCRVQLEDDKIPVNCEYCPCQTPTESTVLGEDEGSPDGDCTVEGIRHGNGTVEITKVTHTPPESTLAYCTTCVQMTNHGIGTNGGCLKCRVTTPPKSKGVEEEIDRRVALYGMAYKGILPDDTIKRSQEHWKNELLDFAQFFTTHRTQLLQEIEGEVESIPRVNPYDSSMNYTGGQQAEIRAYNRAFEDILTIIRNKQIP